MIKIETKLPDVDTQTKLPEKQIIIPIPNNRNNRSDNRRKKQTTQLKKMIDRNSPLTVSFLLNHLSLKRNQLPSSCSISDICRVLVTVTRNEKKTKERYIRRIHKKMCNLVDLFRCNYRFKKKMKLEISWKKKESVKLEEEEDKNEKADFT